MAAPIKPGKHTALQKDSFWLVPAIADIKAPKVAEINAVTGIYLTCFLTEEANGWTTTFNKGTAPRGLCDATTPETLLPATVQGTEIQGFFNPQAAVAEADKKAFEFLRSGYTGFMVKRLNKKNDVADTAAAGEFVSVAPVLIAAAVEDKTATTAEGIYVFKAGVAVTGDPSTNVAVTT